MTKANLAKRVFMDPDSPASFYRDNSYGDWTFQGDAYGPYTIDTSNCANVGRLYPMATDAQNAAKADGFDAANYDNFMYYLPTGSCGWSGIAEVGVNETRGFWNAGHSWYNNSNGCVVLAQELGHNYGLLHSHKCSAPPYQNSKSYGDTSCSDYNEYGDPNTPMGGGCGHFNSPELGAMRFISGCNTLEVTSSGTFEIGPLERKCAGPQVIRVPSGKMANRGPQYIYAEFRLGNGTLGSDSKSPRGLHFYASAEYGGNATGIMADNHDLDYAVDPFYIHAPVGNAGDSWTEPDSMVTFTLMALSQTATVQVTVPGGGSGAPQCSGGGTPPASPMCGLVTDSGTSDTGTGGTGGGPADASTDTSTGGTGGAGTGGAAGSAGTAGVGGAAGTSGAAGAGPGGAAGSAGTSGAGGTAGKGGAAGATAGTGGTTAGSAGTGTGGSAGTAGSSGSSGSAGTGGGKGGTGGTGGTGTGGSTTGGTPPSDDGCSCSIPGGNPSTRTPALLLGLVAALPALRRRRRWH
jgi:MYXO-CTERM domain-containing protein